MPSPFQSRQPAIENNTELRVPQREAYAASAAFAAESEREASIVLPVGCGKSGTITLAPFAFRSKRVLVVAPNVAIAQQLHRDFDPAEDTMFYRKCRVLDGGPYPELVEIRGSNTARADLDDAEVVVTNIQQLQGAENRWLDQLPSDHFDLIVFDEGHHNVAQSWATLMSKFPDARVLNFSATPLRADGRMMSGRIIYSYPIVRAIREGFAKRLKAVVLKPTTLRYVRREDGEEIEVTLDEVKRLGEEDADFRRSIVSSTETLNTIVDASIRELRRLRKESSNQNLKIIASALNFEHCRQVVQAYRERGLRADYVHSREDQAANRAILRKLESNELDVIVQVRKLGEGFDHPLLAVAAVFSIFGNLSPFIQFVGRIMRVIRQNAPDDPINRGVVVYHAGGNCAKRWADFQKYSDADQKYFDELMPEEDLEFGAATDLEIDPEPRDFQEPSGVNVRSQSDVHTEEIHLLSDDPEAMELVKKLHELGYKGLDVKSIMDRLEAVPVTKQRQRQASRASLDMRIKTAVGRILGERRVNPQGYDLDRQRLRRTNYVVLKSAIDRQVNALIDRGTRERGEVSQQEYDLIDTNFDAVIDRAVEEVFRGSN